MADGRDALILDVMLPGKSGFEVCREVRKSLHLPVIMVTAKKEDVDKIRGLGLGADDYLVKPFKMCIRDSGMTAGNTLVPSAVVILLFTGFAYAVSWKVKKVDLTVLITRCV